MAITADVLKSKFGFNDPNVIQGILNDPGQVARYEREMGGGSSGGTPDLSVPSIAEYTEKAYAPVNQTLDAYVKAMQQRANPLDTYTQLSESMGIPQMQKTASTLRESIGGLEDAIKRVESDISGTTSQSLVTESQRRGMVQARQKPLLENLGTLTTGLGRISEGITAASQDLSTRIGLFIQGQKQALEPFEVMLTQANEKAARQVSGYSQDVQNQLSILTAKWQRQNNLEDREWQAVQDALQSEKTFSQTLAQMVEQSKIDLEEYTKKKQIDKSYSGSTGSTDWTKYLPTSGGQSNTYPNYFTPIG